MKEKKRDYTICVAKTKTLISCAVTAQLICVFVFAYADCCFFFMQGLIYVTKPGPTQTIITIKGRPFGIVERPIALSIYESEALICDFVFT